MARARADRGGRSRHAVLDVAGYTLLQLIVPDEVMGRFFTGLESLFTLSLGRVGDRRPRLIRLR